MRCVVESFWAPEIQAFASATLWSGNNGPGPIGAPQAREPGPGSLQAGAEAQAADGPVDKSHRVWSFQGRWLCHTLCVRPDGGVVRCPEGVAFKGRTVAPGVAFGDVPHQALGLAAAQFPAGLA